MYGRGVASESAVAVRSILRMVKRVRVRGRLLMIAIANRGHVLVSGVGVPGRWPFYVTGSQLEGFLSVVIKAVPGRGA